MERTAYMNWLLSAPFLYGFNEHELQNIIAYQLKRDCSYQHLQSFEILEATGDKEYTDETFLKAAKLVIDSK